MATPHHTEEPHYFGYHVQLEGFDGPLDLLLHLIKENKMDIYNIQISVITQQYLQTLDQMKDLDLEIAGEFLVMAATLAHIKSKMLLPVAPEQADPLEDGVDPREELVRRLLEYQKYKDASEKLDRLVTLGKDTFVRPLMKRVEVPKSQRDLMEVSIYKLVQAFSDIQKKLERDGKDFQINRETVSLRECVFNVVKAIRLSKSGSIAFKDLFKNIQSRRRMVVTFLAILNLMKARAIRIFQNETFSDIELIGNQEIYDADWTFDHENQDDYGISAVDSGETYHDISVE